MLARRTMRDSRTLNDHVDDAHKDLMYSDDEYMKFLDAVYDEDAVEGSLSADNLMAARIIRKHAEDRENEYLATKKLATIVKSLNVVLRRYHISRQERAESFSPKTERAAA